VELTNTSDQTDPKANVYRYYSMEIGRGLFGDWALVREWGRIGRSGQVRTDQFGSEPHAKDARFARPTDNAARGYE